jgi:maltose O-acetyltransferase
MGPVTSKGDWGRQQANRYLPEPLKKIVRRIWIYMQGAALYLAYLCGFVPSHHLRRFVYRAIFRVRIGKGSIIHWQTRFFQPGGIEIGEYCNIGNNAMLDGRRGIRIGNRVATGAEIMVYTLQHEIDSPGFEVAGGPVVIGDYVYIGPRAIILPNVTIGTGAVIGAGSVVTRDIPEYSVAAGIPARVIRERPRNLDYRPDFAMPFQ